MTTTTGTGTVKVGDVFVASWGYDQTNIDYEQVVGVTASGKSVYVKPIENAYVGEGSRRRVVADVGNFKRGRWDGHDTFEDTTTRRVLKTYRDETYINWTSFASAYLVDPTVPQYDTIAAGEPGH